MTTEQGQGVLIAVEATVCVDGVCGYMDVTDDCTLCGDETPFVCDSCGTYYCERCVPGADCPQCRWETYGEVG